MSVDVRWEVRSLERCRGYVQRIAMADWKLLRRVGWRLGLILILIQMLSSRIMYAIVYELHGRFRSPLIDAQTVNASTINVRKFSLDPFFHCIHASLFHAHLKRFIIHPQHPLLVTMTMTVGVSSPTWENRVWSR